MAVSWIEHKGKNILFENMCKLSKEEFLDSLVLVEEEYKKANKPFLSLIDITDSFLNQEIMEKIKILAKKYDHKIEKRAIVGLFGIKKILASTVIVFIKSQIKICNSLSEAKNYLCE